MTTIIVILAVWMLLSVPMSVLLGRAVAPPSGEPELVGMDGDRAVFRRSDGTEYRMGLGERSAT